MWQTTLALVALAGLLVSTEASAAVQPAGTGPGPLEVMTYNINHGAGKPCTPKLPLGENLLPDCSALKLQLAAQVIREVGADVVALQEVDRRWARSGLVDQGELLATELGMAYCYGPNLDHPPDEHSALPHQYGNAILSRLPLEGCTNHLLPKATPDTEQRGALTASVRVGDRSVEIFNVHLQHCSPGNPCGPGNPDRTAQIRALVDLASTSEHAVVMGDFNAQAHWPEVAPLHEQFREAWELAGSAGPGNTIPAHLAGEPTRRIDLVFVRGLDVRTTSVRRTAVTRLASDHYPVVAEVAFPP